jgi:hypothetical protein
MIAGCFHAALRRPTVIDKASLLRFTKHRELFRLTAGNGRGDMSQIRGPGVKIIAKLATVLERGR